MTWVRRAEPSAHICQPPVGNPGDLWRCDDCGRMWRVAPPGPWRLFAEWRPARWWQRLRYRDRGKVTS